MAIFGDRMTLPQDVYCVPKGNFHPLLPTPEDNAISCIRQWSPFVSISCRSQSSSSSKSRSLLVLGNKSTKSKLPLSSGSSDLHHLKSTHSGGSRRKASRTSSSRSCLAGKQRRVQKSHHPIFPQDGSSLLEGHLHNDDSFTTCHTSFSSCGDCSSCSLDEMIKNQQNNHFCGPPPRYLLSDDCNPPPRQHTSVSEIDTTMSYQQKDGDSSCMDEETFPRIGWESEDDNDRFLEIYELSTMNPPTTNQILMSLQHGQQEQNWMFPSSSSSSTTPSLKRSKAFGSRLNYMETKPVGRVQ